MLVVGELLRTGVQANTERHTRKETREMCSCWGYKQHVLPAPQQQLVFGRVFRSTETLLWETSAVTADVHRCVFAPHRKSM